MDGRLICHLDAAEGCRLQVTLRCQLVWLAGSRPHYYIWWLLRAGTGLRFTGSQPTRYAGPTASSGLCKRSTAPGGFGTPRRAHGISTSRPFGRRRLHEFFFCARSLQCIFLLQGS